jgi:ELWxxDGT repeat protein
MGASAMRSTSILIAGLLALFLAAPATFAAGPITMVMDVNHSEGSDATELTAVGSVLCFVADDGLHGRELWRKDGTTGGTVLVADIRPGAVRGEATVSSAGAA